MKFIKREMLKTDEYMVSDFCNVQASFNSDGCIVLRHYNVSSKNSDDIVIFTLSETRALIELLRKLTISFKDNELPF